MIKEHLYDLREAMKASGVDVYYFNTSDYHMSEYVPEYFRTILYFSGFSGSLATLLVSSEEAWIFVDGRYHTQADRECVPHGINVVKLGTPSAEEPLAFLEHHFSGRSIGLDARRTSVSFGLKLKEKGLKLKDIDIYSQLIKDRAVLGHEPIYELSDEFTGMSRKHKLEIVFDCLQDKVHVVDNLECIAYLLNLRSNDILFTPVFMAYLVLMDGDCYLFADIDRFAPDVLDDLYADGIIIRPYASYYAYLKQLDHRYIVLDEDKINYASYLALQGRGNRLVFMRSPLEDMKAIKNPIEQENMRLAHIYDGVALLRFLMWLENTDKTTISEYDAAEKIDSLRLAYKARDLSFRSIVAYNANAAQMHYSATRENAAMLDNSGILLFDTGGQYNEGTTDVTRTVALGEVSEEVKKYFTLALKSMFNLSEVKFLQGLCGCQLDVLARKDLWEQGVDYRCGTGHGVGYYLSVHEGPPNIRYSHREGGTEMVEIKPGMICSDEPGVYFEGKFGIRCENMILCVDDEKNEYGQFLRFETLTMVPFDRRLIDKAYLDDTTIAAINRYHQKVYTTLRPYLNDEEERFLRKLTEAI